MTERLQATPTLFGLTKPVPPSGGPQQAAAPSTDPAPMDAGTAPTAGWRRVEVPATYTTHTDGGGRTPPKQPPAPPHQEALGEQPGARGPRPLTKAPSSPSRDAGRAPAPVETPGNPKTLEPTPTIDQPTLPTWLTWLLKKGVRAGGLGAAGSILFDPTVTGEQERERFALEGGGEIRLNHGGPERSRLGVTLGDREIWLQADETADAEGGVLFGLEAAPDLGPVVRRTPEGTLQILAPDLFAGDRETIRNRLADLMEPPEKGQMRQRIGDGLAIDAPVTPPYAVPKPAQGQTVVLRGGLDGVTPLAELREEVRYDMLGRPFSAYVLPQAEHLGAVARRTADGKWIVLQPGLFRDAPSTKAVAERIALSTEVDWEGPLRYGGVVPGSYNAMTETVRVRLILEGSDKETERELPIFVLPKAPAVADLYEMELRAPNADEFIPSEYHLGFGGVPAAKESRRKAQRRNKGREFGEKFKTDEEGRIQRDTNGEKIRNHLHELPASSMAEINRLENPPHSRIFGVIGYVPAEENNLHGLWLEGFYRRHNMVGGQPFLYVHVGLIDEWLNSAPGGNRGRDALSRGQRQPANGDRELPFPR